MGDDDSKGSTAEVLKAFLRLGLTSFGGPIAHIAYFQREFVQRRAWLDDAQFGQLVAICQFLPGPASSQLGFAIGLLRAGRWGALAGFAGFTLPSALLMFAFAAFAGRLQTGLAAAAMHGLQLVAVCVVSYGLVGMVRQLTPDARRKLIAAGACALALMLREPWVQLAAIGAGALAGHRCCRDAASPSAATLVPGSSLRSAAVAIALYTLLLIAAFAIGVGEPVLTRVAAAFYRAGALVFGGGHVVLPLLERSVVAPGWLDVEVFLAGYGAAQAVPGPMFSVAAFLGAAIPTGDVAAAGAIVAVIAIFLPGFLLVSAALPMWSALIRRPGALGAVAGVNAAVVGLLAAALYDPILTHGVRSIDDVVIVTVGLALLTVWRAGALTVVLWCVLASVVAAAALR